MELSLSIPERMLFALLRAGLTQNSATTVLFDNATHGNWLECYELAVSQGVIAIAWDGVLTLPRVLQPERSLRLQWALNVERIENKFDYYSKVLSELQQLYTKNNIALIQLKGIGYASYYPNPKHREGGDIDIYTNSLNKDILSDKQANQLADKLMQDMGIEVSMDKTEKHSEFYFKGVPFENHKTFLNVETFKLARLVESMLKESLNPIQITLIDRECKVNIPSPQFNTLFIPFHAAQHYESGLALHHLCDWAVLINRYGLKIPDRIQGGFRDFVNAMTQLCVELLGTKCDIVENSDFAIQILESMLYPKYSKDLPRLGPLKTIVYKTKRFLYRNSKRNRVLDYPLCMAIYHSIVSHIKRPNTIFH